MSPVPLPIDAHVPAIVEAVRARGAAVVVAPPGAGKTTRVPPALGGFGPLVLLQPRRLAARALARRIAAEQGLALGEDVGWQVRFERRFTARTRLLVATEGVLTARLQSDPLLSGFATVVLDEIHERSLHGDLALALARQAARARGDLRLVVMSATLDPGPIAAFLGGCPVVEVEARAHPVEIVHEDVSPALAVKRALARGAGGHVLCFLPGQREIRQVADELAGSEALVLPLHGSLAAEEQDAALAPSSRRKVILATNVAETSLTVDGVTDVVDTGLARVLRFDPARGLDRLAVERIAQDSADQRAGRAGRTGPGRCVRLWSAHDPPRPRREPEIRRVDLAAPFLDVLAWGADPLELEWLEAPPPEHARAAFALLERLGAVEKRRLTKLGDALRRLPLPPRLARVVVEAGGSRRAAAACALLSERDGWRGECPTTDCDLFPRLDAISRAPGAVREAAREVAEAARRALPDAEPDESDEGLRRALLAGFPDRVARRRERGSPRLVLASGSGATLARESGVREAELLVALDLSQGAAGADPLVRLASAVEREWLAVTSRETVHRFDEATGSVRAVEVARHDALALSETPVAADPARAAPLLAEALVRRGLDDSSRDVLRRAAFAGLDLDLPALLEAACAGRTTLPEVDLLSLLPWEARRAIDELAPPSLEVPSGRRLALEYREDGSVVLAVKLQELFGLAETPRVGARREPVLLELLSPAGRPVQTTRDLASFWRQGYLEVRKELRARYPRHPWPEDPWTAAPTHRPKPRGR